MPRYGFNRNQGGYWIGSNFYVTETAKEATSRHRKAMKELDAKIKAEADAAKAREKELANRFKPAGLSFLEGMKLGNLAFQEQQKAELEQAGKNWGKDLQIYTNPEQLCCYCHTPAPTNRIWVFNRNLRKVLAVIGLDGKPVNSSEWHPHVNGSDICRGDAEGVDGPRAMFLGLNPGSAFLDVKQWLKNSLKHRCWWDSSVPHECVSTWGYNHTECGCLVVCAICREPLCQCHTNLLSRKYAINHSPIPMTKASFDKLVEWAEQQKQAGKWSDEEILFNANYLASLPVEAVVEPEPVPEPTEPIEPIEPTEPTTQETEGGNDAT